MRVSRFVTLLIPVIAGATLTVLSSAALGALVTRAVGFSGGALSRAERLSLDFGVGAASLSTIVFLLCALQAAHPASFALVAACIFAAYWRWARDASSSAEPLEASVWIRDWRCWVYLAIAFAYGGVYFIYALAPEITSDAVAYHLGLVRRYYNHQGFPGITTNIYAFLPQGAEMLYLFAYSIGSHSAAKLVHFALTVATVVTLVAFTARYSTRRAALLAAVLYLCTPVIGMDAASTYNDCALAFFGFLTFSTLVDWQREPSRPALILIGIFAGFCFAIKYTGGVALAGAGLTIFVCTLRRGRELRPALTNCLWFGFAAAALALPWVIKNIWVTGNPFAPLFNDWFPNPYVTSVWEDFYRDSLRHYMGFGRDGWTDYLTAPLEVTIWGQKVQGIIGPIYLLFPLALLAWRSTLVRAATLAATLAALPWLANAGVRFLIPALPFAALAMALSLERLPGRAALRTGIAIGLLHALLSWPWIIPIWHPDWIWRLHPPLPWEYALRLKPESEYLERWLPLYNVARRIDQVARPGDRLLALEQLPEAYMDTEVLVCYQGALNERLFATLATPADQSRWPSQRLRIPLDGEQQLLGFRVSPANSHEKMEWSLSEIVFRGADGKLQPKENWRIEATPFPWDARRIIDADPLSSWYSGEAFHPNMAVEIQFPAPISVTAVEILYPRAQSIVELEFYLRTATKDWAVLASEPVLGEVSLDEATLQGWAGAELRRRGITLLLIDTAGQGHNFIAPMIAKSPDAWGLEELFREGTSRLYRVSASPDPSD